MGLFGSTINDRFRKHDPTNRMIKRKIRTLKSYVNYFDRYKGKHSHMREKARRMRQIVNGSLRAENGLVMT